MKKLSKTEVDQGPKSARLHIRMSSSDHQKISRSAQRHQMGVSEFMRRAALGRTADVSYEAEIVLALRDITQAFQLLHADVERGVPPPDGLVQMLSLEAQAVIARISK